VSLLFEFVQFEFTHAIGPPAGRYLVEPQGGGAEPSRSPYPIRRRVVSGETHDVGVADVLVVGVVPAPASRPRLRRKARDVEPDAPPAEVPLSVVTFVKGTAPVDDDRELAGRLEIVRSSEDEQERWVDEGLAVLN